MGAVRHLHHDTPQGRLVEIEAEVFETVDRMCLRLGALLAEARTLDPMGFDKWVSEKMPFGIDKARRLVAIHLAYSELPEDVVQKLPRPWQAMFALRHWAQGRLPEAIETGEVGPDTTIAEARELASKWGKDSRRDEDPLPSRYGKLDLTAGELMAVHPDDLNPSVYRALSNWMTRRTPDQT